ncbi:unnamed protein product [Caenorhabditis angaria]|uniref:Uncharacterized protein n=1 Tax=Caenorhabditis angaria TaxID=860376 RepID=A0A9P1IBZ0_9PELO|nr:unnamed protein product [Caenorhabditis angaria]
MSVSYRIKGNQTEMIDIDSLSLPILIAVFIGVISVMGTAIVYLSRKEAQKEVEDLDDDVDAVMDEVHEVINPVNNKKSKHQRKNDQWKSKDEFSHPWLVTSLKGHTADVSDIDFASDLKKFVSISEDRQIILWDVRDFENREHRCFRQTLDYDTPTLVNFAPDCKSVIFSTKRENALCVYKLAKKTEGTGNVHFTHVDNIEFPRTHQANIGSIGIAANARYLMSSSADNKVILYDLRGSILKIIDAKLGTLYDCRLSPDGRFVIVSGFSPDVFVYEPTFSRDGGFQDCKKAFNLGGQQSGVLASAFNWASTRAVTISRDGKWRVFDTDIRYKDGQDAKILKEGSWQPLHGATHVLLAVSPSGDSFVVSVKDELKLFNAKDENVDLPVVTNLHGNSNISSIRFSSNGQLIATSGDKVIRILRNVVEA